MDAGAAPYSPKDKVFRADEKNHKRQGILTLPQGQGPGLKAGSITAPPCPWKVDIESGKAQSYQHPTEGL